MNILRQQTRVCNQRFSKHIHRTNSLYISDGNNMENQRCPIWTFFWTKYPRHLIPLYKIREQQPINSCVDGETLIGEAQQALERAQAVQKEYFNRNHQDVQYALGDRLLISKKDLPLPAERDVPWKSQALYDGPYKVTKIFRSRADGRA